VMVGDYRFDLECARAAGAQALLVNLPENPWPELSDGYARDCHGLLAELRSV
jgi:phosphoglycolate phosphatase-like HAD superfamily hydrolase